MGPHIRFGQKIGSLISVFNSATDLLFPTGQPTETSSFLDHRQPKKMTTERPCLGPMKLCQFMVSSGGGFDGTEASLG